MPAAFDAVTTQSATAADFDHTPSGTPTLAVLTAHVRPGGTDTVVSGVTYGGDSMTRQVFIDSAGDTTPGGATGIFTEIWTLVNPSGGQQTVSISITGTAPTRQIYALRTYTGTGAVGTAVYDGDNTNLIKTCDLLSIASATGGIVIDALSTEENEDHTPDEDNTGNERFELTDTSIHACGSDAAGAATVDMGWSWTTDTRFAYAAIPVAEAAAAAKHPIHVFSNAVTHSYNW